MNITAGTSPASVVLTSTADTGAHNYYITKFVSQPLYETSISANTWTYAFAAKESSTSANFPVTSNNKSVWVNAYVWRPSNSSKIGTILDGTTAATVDEGAAATEVYHIVTFSGSAVSSMQDGDVIILEVWFQITQGAATAFTDTFYYDGTTVSAENATVTTPASYLETPENLILNPTTTVTPSDTITVDDTATPIDRTLTAIRSPSADTTSLTESDVRHVIFGRSASDTKTLSESTTRTSISPRTASDTITLSDSLVRTLLSIRLLSDTTVTSDSLVRTLLSIRALSDTKTLSDSLVRYLLLSRTATDTKTLSEDVTPTVIPAGGGGTQTFQRTPSDTITLSESAGDSIRKLMAKRNPSLLIIDL